MPTDRRRAIAAVMAACAANPLLVHAQEKPWPQQRPIRLVVGFPPGGSIDALGRVLAERLGQRLGASVVVDNRTGAAGMLAAEETARQPADGYTLLLIPGGPLMENPTVDVFDDKAFTQIVRLTESPVVLAVPAAAPYTTVRQLIDASRGAAGPIAFASSGVGSLQHLVGEMLAQATGAKLNHVPYRGGGQAITDLVAGHVPLGLLGMAPLLPHIQSGRIRALAVSTATRLANLANVPTLKESGIDIVAASWTGLAGPKDLPQAIVARLVREASDIMSQPEVRAKLEPLGLIPDVLDGAPFVAFTRTDRDQQLKIVRERKIALQ
ncbi:MAG: tripartite tricarboxylate transporter substrate binding protein [Burkholderiaceae bacterium]